MNHIIKKLLYNQAIRDLINPFLRRRKAVSKIQRIKTKLNSNLMRLGSNYGGKYFVHEKLKEEPIMVSFGAGEDISFDLEFATMFKAKVYIYDPTPRSKKHINDIYENLGKNKTSNYSSSGRQEISSYDLNNITKDQISFYDKGVWIESKIQQFYCPRSSESVSHSLVPGLKNNPTADYIDVECIDVLECFKDIINKNGNSDIDLLKIDIEGAETDVVNRIMYSKVRPLQILVEYDKLSTKNDRWIKEVECTHDLLIENNYTLCFIDGFADFTYCYSI